MFLKIPLEKKHSRYRDHNLPSLFEDLDHQNILECGAEAGLAWPFAIDLIPHRFPDPVDLVDRVPFLDGK
jgi:hypothetical protein